MTPLTLPTPAPCCCIYQADNIWVPAGVAVLTRLGFANNEAVMVSVKGNVISSAKPNF